MTVPPLPYGDMPVPEPPARRMLADGRPWPGGRPRGMRSKVSLTLKQAILLAAGAVGDHMADAAAEKGEDREGGLEGYLRMVAATDVKSFCSLLGRVLPMEVTGAGGGSITVEIVKLAASE